jgi:hypothetical protein
MGVRHKSAEHEAAGLSRRVAALALTPFLMVVTLGVGWLVWSIAQWRHGRTPSYGLVGVRVVLASDGRPIGVARSLARCSICLVLVIPTVIVCCVIGLSFVFGASAPDDLLRPRTAPWDYLTRTRVVDARESPDPGPGGAMWSPIDLSQATRPAGSQSNAHAHRWN